MMKYVSVADAERFIATALEAEKVPAADAQIIANLMVQSDLVGADGHGIFRLPAYLKRIRAGGVNLAPNFTLSASRVRLRSLMAITHLVI